jgi:hypothetical protein
MHARCQNNVAELAHSHPGPLGGGARMQLLALWVREALKLLGGRRLHPLTTECPICRQSVRLHVNKAGRRHVLRHAQALYEGARLDVHHVAKMKCAGSKSIKIFDPHPDEQQRFKVPPSLLRDS